MYLIGIKFVLTFLIIQKLSIIEPWYKHLLFIVLCINNVICEK